MGDDWRGEYARYDELKKQLAKLDNIVALEVFGEVVKHFVLKNGEIRTGCNFHKSLQELYKIKRRALEKAQNGQ